jgi:hypothetical protein
MCVSKGARDSKPPVERWEGMSYRSGAWAVVLESVMSPSLVWWWFWSRLFMRCRRESCLLATDQAFGVVGWWKGDGSSDYY